MSVLLPTLLKTTGDSSCLLLVLRAFSVYRYCVAAASCLLSPSPKRRERPSLCPSLLPSLPDSDITSSHKTPCLLTSMYTPRYRASIRKRHMLIRCRRLSPLSPKVLEKGVMCHSLSSLHDVHINPVLRDFFSSTYTDAAIILKNCKRQRHVAPSFFRKTTILLYHVAAPSCYFKTPPSFSHVSLGFFRKPLLCILCRRVFPLFQNIATHRHVSPSLLRLQLRYINPVAELLPVLYNTHTPKL
jgi:hypothetical protein